MYHLLIQTLVEKSAGIDTGAERKGDCGVAIAEGAGAPAFFV